MIEEIRIRSLGVIDSTTLEIGSGLTVITGETGAGKTMVVTALGLLLGGRADPGAVRSGAPTARVEGLIAAESVPALVEGVGEVGGELEDGRVLVARNVAAEGRSRAWVGGAAVPVSTLGRLTEPLVAVHGQSDQHRLLKPVAQREALDRFAGAAVSKPQADWDAAYAELKEVEELLATLVQSARSRAREAEALRHGLNEIEAVNPVVGEDTELAEEETRLGFADTLRGAAETAREALSSDDVVDRGALDALGAVSTARTALEAVREHDREAGQLADRLTEVAYLLTDLAGDVASYATGLETDPARLAAVSERRAAITALTRKYGETVAQVLDWARENAERVVELDGTDERIAELGARRTTLRQELARCGAALSKARSAAAKKLSDRVTAELTGLAMPHARLLIEVSQREASAGATDPATDSQAPGAPIEVGDRALVASAHGFDNVEFGLAANVGADPRPLNKGASGGELSRVMLALEVVLAATSPVPTFVFDEVDAGVGGKAAIEIGRRLAALARSAQVLVVTHLPQVAAFADQHVVVSKSSDGTITTSGLSTLSEAERERELSRMLAGLDDSASAQAHARELLATARAARG